MCLRESGGDHKLESQAITDVAYRQKTKTKQRLENECNIYMYSFLFLFFIFFSSF